MMEIQDQKLSSTAVSRDQVPPIPLRYTGLPEPLGQPENLLPGNSILDSGRAGVRPICIIDLDKVQTASVRGHVG